MLRHTFIHIPGVGRITEERLWGSGIRNWEECLNELRSVDCGLRNSKPRTMQSPSGTGPPFSPRVLKVVESHLEDSCRSLSQGDTAFFEEWLPSREKWRMYPDFANGAVFLDIETTGMSSWWNDITVIGIYDSLGPKVFVKGKDLGDFPAVIKDYSLLITYNGRQFDVPFLKAKFPGLKLPGAHLDLRFPLRRLGLSGGLKDIERQLGMEREGPLREVDGYMAVRLWQEYMRGNKSALETLIRYNLEDVVGLKSLAERAYNMAIKGLPISVPPVHEGERPELDLPYDPELISWLRIRSRVYSP
ncbi:MAG TPA: ribonuclease H-like domain-containing protein [Candidatus Brocadiales bacterium]|nr:ribonuclease H-like domain-containing protein [Candidatus Brocadiales bacterium]